MATAIALSGLMGSGKSVIGRVVAERLGRRFVDLDAEVERAAGASIEELFAEGGETAFRAVERRTLADILEGARVGEEGIVLALGGGTVTWPASASALAEEATVVLLTASLKDQWARAAGTGRPLARTVEAFGRLAEARREIYLCTADVVVDTAGLDVEASAAAVIEAVRGAGVGAHTRRDTRP
ncbi:MAG: shikimate kinase [Thermoleophilia bacterium]